MWHGGRDTVIPRDEENTDGGGYRAAGQPVDGIKKNLIS